MTPRATLAALIEAHMQGPAYADADTTRDAQAAADEILAAGWTGPVGRLGGLDNPYATRAQRDANTVTGKHPGDWCSVKGYGVCVWTGRVWVWETE